MTEKIFWDTWAFLELANQDSNYHTIALHISEQLRQQRTIMVTTEAVMTEVGNAFSKAKVRKFALAQLAIVEATVKQGTAQLVKIETTLWKQAWMLYESRPDKDWGHTDCISFVVMQHLSITRAFTNDKHFEQAGFVRLVKG